MLRIIQHVYRKDINGLIVFIEGLVQAKESWNNVTGIVAGLKTMSVKDIAN